MLWSAFLTKHILLGNLFRRPESTIKVTQISLLLARIVEIQQVYSHYAYLFPTRCLYDKQMPIFIYKTTTLRNCLKSSPRKMRQKLFSYKIDSHLDAKQTFLLFVASQNHFELSCANKLPKSIHLRTSSWLHVYTSLSLVVVLLTWKESLVFWWILLWKKKKGRTQ